MKTPYEIEAELDAGKDAREIHWHPKRYDPTEVQYTRKEVDAKFKLLEEELHKLKVKLNG